MERCSLKQKLYEKIDLGLLSFGKQNNEKVTLLSSIYPKKVLDEWNTQDNKKADKNNNALFLFDSTSGQAHSVREILHTQTEKITKHGGIQDDMHFFLNEAGGSLAWKLHKLGSRSGNESSLALYSCKHI